MDPAAAAQEFTPENKERLRKFCAALSQLTEFNAAAIEQTLKAVAAELGVKAGVLVHPARLACTGSPAGPSLYHLMEVLGKERVLKRLAAYA
jgi:glutamyl-tRNA synthetase